MSLQDQKTIVVAGFMATCPIAGVVWQHIHYLVGLKRLGFDPVYVEDTARQPYDPLTFESGESAIPSLTATMNGLARRFGYRWAYRDRSHPQMTVHGDLSNSEINRLFAESPVTLNICGAQELHDEVLRSKCLIYVESDPGVEQIKLDKKVGDTLRYLRSHHAHFTFGENIGQRDCPLPTAGFQWQATRQPVVVDLWNAQANRKPSNPLRLTTIANWETKGKDIVWKNQIYYWSKTFEFLKFADAPHSIGNRSLQWEMATDMNRDPASQQLFQRQGWSTVSPHELSCRFDDYVSYIQGSDMEWTVAKDQYVRLKTGWFSDRSACYLAAGRPVITQDTLFSKFIPSGEGLFVFRSMNDIRSAIETIVADYSRHSRKALEIAREYFDAEKVVGKIVEGKV